MLERLGKQLQLASKHTSAFHSQAPMLVAAVFILTLWTVVVGVSSQVRAYQNSFDITYDTLETNSANFLIL